MDALQDRDDTFAPAPASASARYAGPARPDHPYHPYAPLRPLLAAEAAAEAPPGAGFEAADLEQAVWLRLLELGDPPPEPVGWVRRAVRAEARAAACRFRGERPYDDEDGGGPPAPYTQDVEDQVLGAERHRKVLAAVRLLPGRCPQVVAALMSRSDPTYQEISLELGISQGSLGPLRSRCLGCLRALLNTGEFEGWRPSETG